MKVKMLWILTCMLMVCISCEKEGNAEVEAELQLYFQRFTDEAAIRGLEVDLETLDISGYIENITDRGILGTVQIVF